MASRCLLAHMMIAVLVVVSFILFPECVEISDDEFRNIEHELTELKEVTDRIENKVDGKVMTAIDGVENKVDDLIEYLFGDVENEALITGKTYHVKNGALTASTSHAANHGPQCSRLGVPKPSSCSSYAWCASYPDIKPWIQVDLGRTFEINAVATQGRGDCCSQWVMSYQIASLRGPNFIYYVDPESGLTKTFRGNQDNTSIIRHAFVPPIRARFVRLYVVTWIPPGCVRWELYGKPAL